MAITTTTTPSTATAASPTSAATAWTSSYFHVSPWKRIRSTSSTTISRSTFCSAAQRLCFASTFPNEPTKLHGTFTFRVRSINVWCSISTHVARTIQHLHSWTAISAEFVATGCLCLQSSPKATSSFKNHATRWNRSGPRRCCSCQV